MIIIVTIDAIIIHSTFSITRFTQLLFNGELNFRRRVTLKQLNALTNMRVNIALQFLERCSGKKNRHKAQNLKKKFQLAAYARALFFRFAVNVKQPIHPTCGSLFDSSIALKSESIHQ